MSSESIRLSTMEQSQRFKQIIQPWMVCFAASLFFFYQFIQGNMFASIADHVMKDFHIEAHQFMLLSSIYYLSNVLFLVFAGLLLDQFSPKKILLLCMAICTISTFILAQTQLFWIAFLCRFIAGITSAFCFLAPVRLATSWFPPKRMALVTGAIVTMAMTGGLVAQYPLTALVLNIGWRYAVIDVGWLGLMMLVLMVWWIKDTPEGAVAQKPESIPMKKAWQGCLSPQPILSGLYTSLMNLPIAVLGAAMGKLYLVQRLHVLESEAAMVNGMLFLGSMIGGPLVGFFSDQLGLRLLPMKLGAIISLATVLAIIYMPVSMFSMGVLFFILGVTTSSQVISYVLVAESAKPMFIATCLSIVSIFTQAGYLVYQNLFSTVLVHSGEVAWVEGTPVYSIDAFQTAVLILPIAFLIALVLVWGLKETYGRPSHD